MTSRRRHQTRGFTLVELMVVVTIIGVFVGLAGPAMSTILSDRYSSELANRIAGMYRLAQARSQATGAAHMVRVTGSGTAFRFELVAAMSDAAPPNGSCRGTNWLDPVNTKILDCFHIGNAAGTCADLGGHGLTLTREDGMATSEAFCFTAAGRPWWSTAGTLAIPAGSAHGIFRIQRLNAASQVIGLVRTVRISTMGSPQIGAE